MVLDIKMCRFDNAPWGFRLMGGSDFEKPLTVVKVTEDGLADKAGLRVGDVIVRINDTAVSPLTHDEAHKIIMHCGNVFFFGVQRPGEEEQNQAKTFPDINIERPPTDDSIMDEFNAYSDDSRSIDEYLEELCNRPSSVLSEHSETKLVEEEIAAVLSGESEVLKDHNVMGIFPKPGVCMSSDVLRTLNEEATKTKAEKEKENKKWTTFLQKPNRPIPRSKAQIEADRRAANAYKVKIVKSERRSVSPAVEKKPITPEPPKEPSPPKPPTPPTESQEAVEEEAPPTDTEVPNLEGAPATNTEAEQSAEGANTAETEKNQEEKIDTEKEASPDAKEASPEQMHNEAKVDSRERTPSDKSPPTETERPRTAEELALERQLADVQRQLQALSSLPSTIQATLDAVTRQLGELLPTFKLQQVQLTKQEPREINLECIDETKEETKEKQADEETTGNEQQEKNDTEEDNKQFDVKDSNGEETLDSNLVQSIDGCSEDPTKDPAKQQASLENQEETRQMEEEQNLKKQKIELWNRLFNGENISRAVFREYHGASVSLQLELDRVNFMKYQKPERKIDLNRSEVYKIIHHLDRQPVRGIEVRAPVVPAAADIKKAVQA